LRHAKPELPSTIAPKPSAKVLDWSPDGAQLATLTHHGTAIIWDAAEKELLPCSQLE
jgi:hypothetical protein